MMGPDGMIFIFYMLSFKAAFSLFSFILIKELLVLFQEWKVSDFIFGGSKITADGDCSHEIKTLTPWKESYDQPYR